MRTLNRVWLMSMRLPSISALTVMTASCPTWEGRATHVSPWRVRVPLVIDAETLALATPGTEMLMGLSMPAYSTFIIVAETVAVGSMTV